MTLRGPPAERSIDARRGFGVINLDKPPGPSSHQVVSWVKDLLDVDRAAHAGTLDPAVTGCLPILVGEGTRIAQALLIGPKRYVAVLEVHDRVPDALESVLETFEGEIYQRPPRKSAVARRLRTRTVYHLEALETHERRVLLDIECESGTYIRKLCHDLGLALGVGAHMGELRRTATTPFDDTTLVTMHDLADAVAFAADGDKGPLSSVLEPAERGLAHIPEVTIAPSAAEAVADGAPGYAPGVIEAEPADQGDLVVGATPDGAAVCLGRFVGDPGADEGEVVSLERVLVGDGSDQSA